LARAGNVDVASASGGVVAPPASHRSSIMLPASHSSSISQVSTWIIWCIAD
jgi:hypothetical protein